VLTGEYWIDPNEGDIRDAILVYCDAKKRATCILPNPSRSPDITHITDQQETWLSEIDSGMKVALCSFLLLIVATEKYIILLDKIHNYKINLIIIFRLHTRQTVIKSVSCNCSRNTQIRTSHIIAKIVWLTSITREKHTKKD